MISIVAKFIINEGEENNFLTLTKGLVEASQKEKGCVEYALHKDIKNDKTYVMIEKWQDQAAIDFHNNSPHFTNTVPKIAEIAQVEVDLYKPV